jgi:rare lipoprotein A
MLPSNSRSRALTLAGALTIATVPAVATAQNAAPQATASASPVTATLTDSHIRYGSAVRVTGRIAQASAGTPVVLEFRPRGGQWGAVGKAETGKDGRYRLRGEVRRTGALRVVVAGGSTTAVAAGPAASSAGTSRELGVRVAAALRTTKVRRDVVAGRSATVSGRVLPAGSGRVVRLQVRRGGAWKTVDRDATSKGGAYALRWKTRGIGRMSMRVRVGSDAGTTAARRTLGRLNVYRRVFASWYGPGFYGGRTACGQTLGYGTLGVAHKSLPCGTKITFRLRGRKVTVPVIDRGPYVGGREYDLTGATKRALGFGSTGHVLATT